MGRPGVCTFRPDWGCGLVQLSGLAQRLFHGLAKAVQVLAVNTSAWVQKHAS